MTMADPTRSNWIASYVMMNELQDEASLLQYGLTEDEEFLSMRFDPSAASSLN